MEVLYTCCVFWSVLILLHCVNNKKDSLLDHLMSVSHLKCSFHCSSTKGNCASTSDTSPHISRIKKTISILAQCELSPNIAISVDRQSKKVEHTKKTVSTLKLKRSKYCFSLFCFWFFVCVFFKLCRVCKCKEAATFYACKKQN